MRERDVNRKLFNAGHYNIIAGRLKRALEPYMLISKSGMEDDARMLHVRVALVDLCLEFAYRLQADSEDFDPIIFLTRCSPNPEEYPLAELWNIDNYNHSIKVEG